MLKPETVLGVEQEPGTGFVVETGGLGSLVVLTGGSGVVTVVVGVAVPGRHCLLYYRSDVIPQQEIDGTYE